MRECLLIREKTEPDAWTTFHTKSLLGGSLLGQKNLPPDAAEPLLLAGYEGMKAREAKIPPKQAPSNRRPGTPRPTLRSLGQARPGGRVAEEVGSD